MFIIKNFEEHPDFGKLSLSLSNYYLKDENGEIKRKNGIPIKNQNWEKDCFDYRNPFYLEMVREIRSFGTRAERLDGSFDITGIWIDFRPPPEKVLPVRAEISYRYGEWSQPYSGFNSYRYCYASAEYIQLSY